MTFIQLFEQWIKDGDKDIYMLPTEISAKDKKAEEVLELLEYYYDKYKTDKSAIIISDRVINDKTLELLNLTRNNLQPLIDKCFKKLKRGNFAGSEKDDKIPNQFVYIFIKENFFREKVRVSSDKDGVKEGKHLYIKFQFVYKKNMYKSLEFGKKNKARIDPNEIILKDISLHPTDKLTI